MRTLQENKAEIFRRAQERTRKRQAMRRRVIAVGLSVACVFVVAAILLWSPREPMIGAPMMDEPKQEYFQDGSYVCTYVRAEIRAGDEVRTVTDKAEVTKLFEALFDSNGTSDNRGSAATGQSGGGYRVILYNEDGTSVDYILNEAQWQSFEFGMEEGS